MFREALDMMLGKVIMAPIARRAVAGGLVLALAFQGGTGGGTAQAQAGGLGQVGRQGKTIQIHKKHTVDVKQLPQAGQIRGNAKEAKPFLPAPLFPRPSVPAQQPAAQQQPAAPASVGLILRKSAGANRLPDSAAQLLDGQDAVPVQGDDASSSTTTMDETLSAAEFLAAPSTATLERLTTFQGLSQNGKTPSDTQIAVGPNDVVQFVNVTGQITDKAGGNVKSFDLGSFFGFTAGTGTDPRVLYDAPSGRFFAAYEGLPAGGDETDVAVSATSDPRGAWSVYNVKSNTSNTLQDQEKLGVTSDKVSLSWNDYDATKTPNVFTGVETAIVNKSELLAGGTITITTFAPDTGRFQVVPAHSLSSVNDHYMMWHGEGDSNVKVLTVTGVPGVSTVNMSADTSIDIGTADSPPAAAQPTGGDATITTNDGRMLSVSWQNNRLVGVFNVKCTPPGDTTTRACQRYVQISTPGLGLTHNDNLGMNGGDIYFGAVGWDDEDDLFSGFTASSSTLFPTAVAIGVPGGAFPSTTFGDFYQSGTQAFVCGCGTGIQRWGDYSGIARDPSHPKDMWTAQQTGGISNPAGGWGTGIDRVTLAAPTVSSISPNHGPELSSCTTNVTVNGTEFDGSSTVRFGSAAASNVSVGSPERLSVDAPSQVRGTVDVTVSTTDGTSPTSSADRFTYDPDTVPPTTTAGVSPAPVNGWNKAPATVSLNAADNTCGSGVKEITYSASGAQTIAPTTVAGAAASFNISNEGDTTVSFGATDNANNVEGTNTRLVRIDNTPPVISCGSADGVWHANDVSIACTASDAKSGLANSADASFSLSTNVAAGTETANASTNSRSICDAVGNCATAGPISGNMVDKKPPSIAITTPPAGSPYLLNQAVPSSYGCTDGGSGVATCVGTVPNGSNVPTGSVGNKTFTVSATDKVANASTASAAYQVTYKICLQYDPTKALPVGATLSIRIQLCDANNVNVSNKSITLTAISVTPSGTLQSSSNPGNVFVLSTGVYVYNLNTKNGGYAPGTYNLHFVVTGDPVEHVVPFLLK